MITPRPTTTIHHRQQRLDPNPRRIRQPTPRHHKIIIRQALERARAARMNAMRELIAAREDASAASSEDRDALKRAALVALAGETGEPPA